MTSANLLTIPEETANRTRRIISRPSVRRPIASWFVMVAVSALAVPAEARRFSCPGGDARCLIDAIAAANANGNANTIRLSAGVYSLTAAGPDGQTGLPPITGTLTIVGEGAEHTVIERSATAPFRLFSVPGNLSLRGVTLRGGGGLSGGVPGIVEGGGILAAGQLVIADSVIMNCQAREGAGLKLTGTGTVVNSTMTGNTASVEGGAILVSGNRAVLEILDTTISSNSALFGGGVDVKSGGTVGIRNTTVARNSAFRGSAIHVGPPPDAPIPPGTVFTESATVENSTIAENVSANVPFSGRAVNTDFAGTTIFLKDTILANNTPSATADCPDVRVSSRGFNLVGNADVCPTFLQTNDLHGDPRLGPFVDDGTPGHGYFPLLPDSPAIDAGGVAPAHRSNASGNARASTGHADCPATDQIGQPRVARCDIGAIELVSDRVSIRQARFDAGSQVLFVSATSSAARDDVSLAVSVGDCLVETPMLRLGRSYLLLTQPACGNLDGSTVTVTSSGGGSASTQVR